MYTIIPENEYTRFGFEFEYTRLGLEYSRSLFDYSRFQIRKYLFFLFNNSRLEFNALSSTFTKCSTYYASSVKILSSAFTNLQSYML